MWRFVELPESEISGLHADQYEDVLSSGMLLRTVSQKLTDVSEVLTASIIRTMIAHIALMMEAVIISETSVSFCETFY
jgi:hypothetical protein